MLRAIREVRHVEGGAEELGLVMKFRSRHVLRHLLKESGIGRCAPRGRDDAVDAVPPIESADALVDVVGNDSKAHGAGVRGRGPTRLPSSGIMMAASSGHGPEVTGWDRPARPRLFPLASL